MARKKEPNPKVRITVWPRLSEVENCGGEDAAKEIGLKAIQTHKPKKK